MQPSELLRCELGEVTTARAGGALHQLSTGQSKGLPGGGTNKKILLNLSEYCGVLKLDSN